MNALVGRLSNRDKKEIAKEIRHQTGENVKNLSLNIQSLVLWNLHTQLKFGRKRLIRFQKSFLPLIEELQRFYMVADSEETEFVLLHKLKNEVGVDVKELNDMFLIECVIKD